MKPGPARRRAPCLPWCARNPITAATKDWCPTNKFIQPRAFSVAAERTEAPVRAREAEAGQPVHRAVAAVGAGETAERGAAKASAGRRPALPPHPSPDPCGPTSKQSQQPTTPHGLRTYMGTGERSEPLPPTPRPTHQWSTRQPSSSPPNLFELVPATRPTVPIVAASPPAPPSPLPCGPAP